MSQSLLAVPVRTRKDLLRLRQRSRQLAAMAGYSTQDQAAMAAAVFAIACQSLRQHGACVVHFQLADNVLRIFPACTARRKPSCADSPGAGRFRLPEHAVADSETTSGGSLRIEKPLPPRDPPLAAEDLAFAVRQLDRLTPADLFAEIERQNQEVLQVLLDLRASQTQVAELTPTRNPSAA